MNEPSSRPTIWELIWQSLHDVEKGYDLLAAKFDRSAYITPEKILRPFFQRLSEEGPFTDGLDVCCGTGAATIHLAPLCSGQVVGVDLSQAMLQQAAQKFDRLGLNHVQLQQANALKIDFKDRFDLVVSFGAFGHILEREEVVFLQNIFEGLRSGGKFCFITTRTLPWYSMSHFLQRVFNGIMHVRNLVIRPKFIMYYLTFRLPAIKEKLEQVGFSVRFIDDLQFDEKFNYLIPLKYFKMVIAEKR